MDVWLTFLEIVEEHWNVIVHNLYLFLALGLIEGVILWQIWKRRYGDKLKELPNLTKIQDDLRQAREDNFRLSEENRGLRADNDGLKAEIVALKTDREVVEAMKPTQTADTLGKRMSEALKS